MSPYHSSVGKIEQRDGVVYIVTDVGDAGCVVFGPYCLLTPGNYLVEFYAMPAQLDSRTCCVVDVLRRGKTIVAEKDFTASELIHRNGIVPVRFEVIETDTFEFRLNATGSSALAVRYQRPLRLLKGPERDQPGA